MGWYDRLPTATPRRAAALYGVVGALWILFSDRLVLSLADTSPAITRVQTAKGWLFVAASTVLIYGLTATQHHQLTELSERLRAELQQVSILHRVLRHNVRNQCTIIQGYVRELAAEQSGGRDEHVEPIENATDKLVALSEKAARLNAEIEQGEVVTRTLDVGAVVEDVAADAASRYPGARIDVTVPDAPLTAVAPRALPWVVEELVENAVKHNDAATPHVDLTVDASGAHVGVTVADDGPGLPASESDLLALDVEDQLHHSQGIGLWVARILVTLSGGTFEIRTNDGTGGTAVEIELGTANSGHADGTHE